MGFGIPTFQLFCLLVDVHRILPTYALALSARQVYARTNPYQHYALGETGTRDLGLYLVGTTLLQRGRRHRYVPDSGYLCLSARKVVGAFGTSESCQIVTPRTESQLLPNADSRVSSA